MVRSGQSTATQWAEAPDEESSFGMEVPLPGSDQVVRRALSRRNLVTTPHTDEGEEADTKSGYLPAVNAADPSPIVGFPPPVGPPRRRATLHPLQEWEGYVVEIAEDAFVARLVDLTAGRSYVSEEAVIPLAEISSERDVRNMTVGSIFRWVIGYERSPEGTRKRVSQIVFRDLPRMTEADLRAGRDWARKISTALNP